MPYVAVPLSETHARLLNRIAARDKMAQQDAARVLLEYALEQVDAPPEIAPQHAPPTARKTSTRLERHADAILLALKDAPAGMYTNDLRALLKMSAAEVSQALNHLLVAERITRERPHTGGMGAPPCLYKLAEVSS